MIGLSSRALVTFALTLVSLSLFMLSVLLGLFPDIDRTRNEARVAVAETLALGLLEDIEQQRLNDVTALLRFAVERNTDLESIALRSEVDDAVYTAGDHAGYWIPRDSGQSSDEQLVVPIMQGAERWGVLELRFHRYRAGGLAGTFGHPVVRYGLFLFVAGLVAIYTVLGRMLRALDPSRAVPTRVRSALDTISDGLIAIDVRGQIMLVNAAFARLAGRTSDELVGRRVDELAWGVAETDNADAVRPWRASLDEGIALVNQSMYLADAEGRRRTFLVNCSPVRGGEGGALGALIGLSDVTELEEKEIELRRSKEEAEAANRSKSEFLANMSHEIRTPMNAILGFTSLLRRGYAKDAEQRQQYLQTIESSGGFLLNLINDLLDLSKIEAGSLTTEILDCHAHEIVRDVCNALKLKADENGIELSYGIESPIPASIKTDPTRFRQIVTNLVGNAVKFTEQGSVHVGLSVDESAPSQLVVRVKDTGVGMTQTQMQGIFESFVQADSSITRRFGGTGLGLSISRQLAQALGGDIEVDSQPGVGSVFTVRIATGDISGVARVAEVEQRAAPTATQEAASDTVQLSQARILVADDNKQNRDLISLVLTEHGVRVFTVENGQEAVEAATDARFDIILMDVQMPVMDGVEATGKLRELGVKTPIIALTALVPDAVNIDLEAAGFDGFSPKPIDVDDLLRMLTDRLAGDNAAQRAAAEVRAAAPRSAGAPIKSRLPTHDPRYRAIVQEFIDQLGDTVAQMRKAHGDGASGTLAELAHYLKGVAGSMGYADFTKPCKELEQSVGDGDEQNVQRWLDEIGALAERVVLDDDDELGVAV